MEGSSTSDTTAAVGRLHGVVSHLSAVQAWGWKVKRPAGRPVVTAPGSSAGMVTARVQTVIDCARSLPFDEALSVADSVLREGVVRREVLLEAAAGSPRTGRQRALRVVRSADPRADNPFESCLRAIALDVPGLSVQPQVAIAGIGRADLGDPRLHLILEADSHEFHSDRAAFRHDIRRYTAMVQNGWLVLRFCWEDVMQHPDRVHAALVDAVALAERSVHTCRACGSG